MSNPKYLFAAVVFAVPAMCFAQSKAPAQEQAGVYIGGSAGQSSTSFDSNDFGRSTTGVDVSFDKTYPSWKLFVGYNFNRNWAIEGGYSDLGKPVVRYAGTGVLAPAGLTGQATLKNTSWFFAGKGTLPITDAFGLFAKLGVTRNNSDLAGSIDVANAAVRTALVNAGFPLSISKSENRTGLLAGVGVEYSLQRNFRIRAEYEDYGKFGNENDTGRTKTNAWSIGMTYAF